MHGKNVQFWISVFLDSRNKSLPVLKVKENERTKEEQRNVLVAKSAYNSQNAQFGLVMLGNGKELTLASFLQF